MQFVEAELIDITRMIWSTTLGWEVSQDTHPAVGCHRDLLTASVPISGAWNGAVLVNTSLAFATQAAAIMMDLPAAAIATADVHDALAELTNMIGGNLKSVLPGPSYLGLPSVAQGQDYEFSIPRSDIKTQLSFECRGNSIRILVVEAKSKPVDLASRGRSVIADQQSVR